MPHVQGPSRHRTDRAYFPPTPAATPAAEAHQGAHTATVLLCVVGRARVGRLVPDYNPLECIVLTCAVFGRHKILLHSQGVLLVMSFHKARNGVQGMSHADTHWAMTVGLAGQAALETAQGPDTPSISNPAPAVSHTAAEATGPEPSRSPHKAGKASSSLHKAAKALSSPVKAAKTPTRSKPPGRGKPPLAESDPRRSLRQQKLHELKQLKQRKQ